VTAKNKNNIITSNCIESIYKQKKNLPRRAKMTVYPVTYTENKKSKIGDNTESLFTIQNGENTSGNIRK